MAGSLDRSGAILPAKGNPKTVVSKAEMRCLGMWFSNLRSKDKLYRGSSPYKTLNSHRSSSHMAK